MGHRQRRFLTRDGFEHPASLKGRFGDPAEPRQSDVRTVITASGQRRSIAPANSNSNPSDNSAFMEAFVQTAGDEFRKGHFPDVWAPSKQQQKACLLSPDSSKLVGVASAARAAPDVRTIICLQQALKMLGYRLTVDGDYGPEARQVVTSLQMHAGIVADGVAGAQTEARLTRELNDLPLIQA